MLHSRHHFPTMASRLLPVNTPLLRTPRPVCGPFARMSILFRKLSLAYTLQNPTSSQIPLQSEPLILLHGLFGSRKNFQSIDKYVAAIPSIKYLKQRCSQVRVLARDLNKSVYALVRILIVSENKFCRLKRLCTT